MKTILLIDDDVQMLRSYSLLLRTNGYHVLEANSGTLGLKMAREHAPDLILSDINMPGGDGTELLRNIRRDAQLKSVQIVLMTGKPDHATPRRVMDEGADDFLVKPVSMEALLACLEARFHRAAINAPQKVSPAMTEILGPEGGSKAWLENATGGRIPLHGICTFGRTKGNTVVLPTDKVSRRHAMIHEQDGEFWLVDLGSTNGVEVNGDRVTHPVRLRPDDRIQMPDHLLTFKSQVKAATTTQTAKPRRAPPLKQHRLTVADVRLTKCWLLLADLQGFTQMSQQVDANELAPIVGSWIADCQAILFQQRGILAKFLGDGFLAYWSDREESVAAVASACREFQVLQKSAPPFRVVVHYGVISFGGHSPDASHTMIGPELNFAFRLEKVAARLDLAWIFSDAAAAGLQEHLPLLNCGGQKVPDFAVERTCFTLAA
jgi:CheY-like chemotaxis protein